MGQPYIELRHRAPEHRLRLPFPPSAELQARPVRGPPLGQHMVMQQQQHAVSSAPLGHNSQSALPGAEIEEHLEGEDSAVKDLEDVEVKDLVDLNLNLDPEDGTQTVIQLHICEDVLSADPLLVLCCLNIFLSRLSQVRRTWISAPMTSTLTTSFSLESLILLPTLTPSSTWRKRKTCSMKSWTSER